MDCRFPLLQLAGRSEWKLCFQWHLWLQTLYGQSHRLGSQWQLSYNDSYSYSNSYTYSVNYANIVTIMLTVIIIQTRWLKKLFTLILHPKSEFSSLKSLAQACTSKSSNKLFSSSAVRNLSHFPNPLSLLLYYSCMFGPYCFPSPSPSLSLPFPLPSKLFTYSNFVPQRDAPGFLMQHCE